MTLDPVILSKVLGWKIITRRRRDCAYFQPSLDRSMAALESELGITLFEKKGAVSLHNARRTFSGAWSDLERLGVTAERMERARLRWQINIVYIFHLAGQYIRTVTFLDKEKQKRCL